MRFRRWVNPARGKEEQILRKSIRGKASISCKNNERKFYSLVNSTRQLPAGIFRGTRERDGKRGESVRTHHFSRKIVATLTWGERSLPGVLIFYEVRQPSGTLLHWNEEQPRAEKKNEAARGPERAREYPSDVVVLCYVSASPTATFSTDATSFRNPPLKTKREPVQMNKIHIYGELMNGSTTTNYNFHTFAIFSVP